MTKNDKAKIGVAVIFSHFQAIRHPMIMYGIDPSKHREALHKMLDNILDHGEVDHSNAMMNRIGRRGPTMNEIFRKISVNMVRLSRKERPERPGRTPRTRANSAAKPGRLRRRPFFSLLVMA